MHASNCIFKIVEENKVQELVLVLLIFIYDTERMHSYL